MLYYNNCTYIINKNEYILCFNVYIINVIQQTSDP